jgi:hypothetical protein
MKIVKVLLVLALVLAIGVAGLVWFGMSKLDSLAKTLIEKGGTHVLAVDTTLQKADVQLSKSSFAMEGLKIANPTGYNSSHFLTLGAGGVTLDPKTIQSDLIELPTLTLSSIDVNLEKAGGKANYQQILENAKRFESSGSSAPPSSGGSDGPKFVIRRIEIRDINAHAQLLPIGGDATKVDVNVPELVLTDVGSGGKPLTTAELINLLTKSILASIISVGGNTLSPEMLNDLQGSLGSLSSLGDIGTQILDKSGASIGDLQGTLGGLKGAAGDAAKGLQDTADKLKEEADKIGGGVKDLLGGGNKDK